MAGCLGMHLPVPASPPVLVRCARSLFITAVALGCCVLSAVLFLCRTTSAHHCLPLRSVQAEYIWVGGSGMDMRSKTKTLTTYPANVSEIPVWNFDGSSTAQASGDDSEVLLHPVKVVRDPFRRGDHILVLCECRAPDGTSLGTRSAAKEVFDRDLAAAPWFGLEQEYVLFQAGGVSPLGWPAEGYPRPQGPYYCSVGADCAYGRNIVEAHYRACLHAGLSVSGINAEVMPAQWEFQVGPCEGIDAGDQFWIARFILLRICEMFDATVSFDPKPVEGDWNGSGCHVNFSTRQMREEGGYATILEAIERLSTKHAEHMTVYGEGNERRLTGEHETAPMDRFSYGVGSRKSSIRIPRLTEAENKGYFEDRRPAANIEPYQVTAKIFDTCHFG